MIRSRLGGFIHISTGTGFSQLIRTAAITRLSVAPASPSEASPGGPIQHLLHLSDGGSIPLSKEDYKGVYGVLMSKRERVNGFPGVQRGDEVERYLDNSKGAA